MLRLRTKAAVPWGGYSIVLEGLLEDGTVCFSTATGPYPAGVPLLPGENGTLVLSRVPIDAAHESCRDCTVESEQNDCPDLWVCMAGICEPRRDCGANLPCPSGEACDGEVCRPAPL
jgi:hypothetical protein